MTWLLALLACKGTPTEHTDTDTDSDTDVADTDTDVPAPVPTQTTTTESWSFGYSGPDLTCEAQCLGAGHVSCTDTCGFGAGDSVYTFSENGFTANEQIPVDTCDTPVSATWEDFFDVYDLTRLTCCCLTLQQVIEGDIDAPVSCDDVCADAGLACNPDHEWSAATDGQQLTYRRPEDGSRHIITRACAFVPPLDRTDNGRYEVLESQECGCF